MMGNVGERKRKERKGKSGGRGDIYEKELTPVIANLARLRGGMKLEVG
jgi:hypothetical protein